MLALIAQRFGPAKRGGAMGWYLAAGSFGYAVSLIACAALLRGRDGAQEWLYQQSAPSLARHSDRSRCAALATLPHASALLPWLDSARQLWQNKPAQLAIWSYSFHSWELLGMWAWLPTFLVAAAATAVTGRPVRSRSAWHRRADAFLAVIGSIAGGTLSDRIGRTRVILIMSCASLACSFHLAGCSALHSG